MLQPHAAVRSPPRGRVSRTHPVARVRAQFVTRWDQRTARRAGPSRGLAQRTRTSEKDRHGLIVSSIRPPASGPRPRPRPRRYALFPPCPRARAGVAGLSHHTG